MEVVFDENATIDWQYNLMITRVGDDSYGQIQPGHHDGNTQKGVTEVNVFSAVNTTQNLKEDGTITYDDNLKKALSIIGAHEDGHIGGLEHPSYTRNRELRNKLYRDPKNLMKDPTDLRKDSTPGTNILPIQRTGIIKTVEEEQNNN